MVNDKDKAEGLYRRYAALDIVLLLAMAAGLLPLWYLAPYLPSGEPGGLNTGVLVGIVFLALAVNAYAWQRKDSTDKRQLIAQLMLLVFGVLLISEMPFYGYMMIYAGAWSLLRIGAMRLQERGDPPVVGAPIAPTAAAVPQPKPLRKNIYRMLPVTMGIVTALAAIFTLEVLANIGPLSGLLSPSLYTLVAFGGLEHQSVLQGHEWYRLFASALLHVSLVHLFFNCYALFLIGLMLENFIGRAWFLALFVLGSVGGSLMSLAINPDELVSVGASGAIVALFAAALTTSFRRPNPEARSALQKWLIQVLVLSLLPLVNFGGGRIDIAGHLGGAVTGGIVGLILWAIWDQARQKPRFGRCAVAISVLGLGCFAYAAVPAMHDYPHYVAEAKLHPIPTPEEQKAAADALAAAQQGYDYEYGKGVKQDYGHAAEWYRKGAEGGNAYAQSALARLYMIGQGVGRDYSQAMQWAAKAAQQGDAYGEFQMGYLYGNGWGAKLDYAQALDWFRKSAAQNNPYAEYALGEMYIRGLGVHEDDAQGLGWVEKAALQGDAEAEGYLGYLYEKGIGVKPDRALAAKWYGEAARQGNMTAADALAHLGASKSK